MLDSNRLFWTSIGLATAAVALSVPSARAQSGDEEEFDRTPRKCVSTFRIRDTDVLDDRTIIFHMRGNREVYRTYLPRECPGLERNDRFSYRTQSGQLCSVDTITVIEQIGMGYHPTFTCRLGEFLPITREEAEELKDIAEGGAGRRESITSKPAELPPEGEAQSEPKAEAAAQSQPEPPPAKEPSRRERKRGAGVTVR